MSEKASALLDTDELRSLLGEVLEIPPGEITDDVTFADGLGVDSLALLEMTDRLEARYGIEVSDAEMKDVDSMEELRNLVAAKLGDGARHERP